MEENNEEIDSDASPVLGPLYQNKWPLFSSHGTLPGIQDAKLGILDPQDLYDAACSQSEYKPDHEACNHLTLNTRPVFGGQPDLDLPLYEYSPLPPTGWVRLIQFTIDGTEEEGDLHCEIHDCPLDIAEKLQYRALSYAWGDPYRTHHVLCNDARIPITANLANWFKYCQPGDYLFWIDAICINQTDKQERSSQVEQMREVYRNASTVTAWLGGILHPRVERDSDGNYDLFDSEDTVRDMLALMAYAGLHDDIFLDFTGLYTSLSNVMTMPGRFSICFRLAWTYLRIQTEKWRGLLRMLYHSIILPLKSPPQPVADLLVYNWHYTAKRHMHGLEEHPIQTLFRRPYFSRRWIIQELLSARSIDRVMYQWDNFVLNAIPMGFAFAAEAEELSADTSISTGQADESAIFRRFMTINKGQMNTIESRTPSMDVLLLAVNVHTFECLDPRDRVYCLTGMYPQLSFKVDYTRPVEEVYMAFASHLVMKDPSCLPTLLTCAVWHPSDSASWSSWVPDWRNRIIFDNVRDASEGFSANAPRLSSECLEFIQLPASNPHVLTTCGFYVGFIAGRNTMSSNFDGSLIYPVITACGNLAWISVRRDLSPLSGDLIFDIGRLFIVRRNDAHQARLVAHTLYGNLFWTRRSVTGSQALERRVLEILNWRECLVHDEPHSFAYICNKTDDGLLRLRESFPDADGLVNVAALHNPRSGRASDREWQAFHYSKSIEFPRSQCLSVFDMV